MSVRERSVSQSLLDEIAPSKGRSLMDRWKELERQYVMIPLQTNITATWFKVLMQALGEACTGDGLVVLFALLNWCFSNKWGTEGIWLVPIAEIVNGIIKWHFRSPRPAWVDKSVVQMGLSHEYSFPSSHSMISFSLAVYFSSVLASSVPYYIAAAVAFSRVYEGMHYPHDVVTGSVLGTGLGYGLLYSLAYMGETNFGQTKSMQEKLLLGGGFTALLTTALLLSYRSLSTVKIEHSWSENVKKSLKGRELDPHGVPFLSYIGMAGVLGGLTVGETIFYDGPGFEMPTSFVNGVFRFVLGVTVLMFCFFMVRVLEKKIESRSTAAAILLRFFRFFQVPVIILQVVPPMFEIFGI